MLESPLNKVAELFQEQLFWKISVNGCWFLTQNLIQSQLNVCSLDFLANLK